MTRAKHDLHLIAPLKYYITQQSRKGDRHVYGAKSRFLTQSVMARLESVVWPEKGEEAPGVRPVRARVDVAGRLRGMWT
jgi:DNA helicase-2/ATP-dependent DNA helicase PcrA